MKKILLLVSVVALVVACSKKEKKEGTDKHCPVIAASAVPQAVKDSFAVRYTGTTVTTWFQKDNIGYCAFFMKPANQRKLAEFSTSGSFISEETDVDHNGSFEDSTGTTGPKGTTTCECEIPE